MRNYADKAIALRKRGKRRKSTVKCFTIKRAEALINKHCIKFNTAVRWLNFIRKTECKAERGHNDSPPDRVLTLLDEPLKWSITSSAKPSFFLSVSASLLRTNSYWPSLIVKSLIFAFLIIESKYVIWTKVSSVIFSLPDISPLAVSLSALSQTYLSSYPFRISLFQKYYLQVIYCFQCGNKAILPFYQRLFYTH